MNEEIYPNTPIVLVVAEIKHVKHGPLDEQQIRSVSQAVRDYLPLRDDAEERTVAIVEGQGDAVPRIQTATAQVIRWSSRDRRTVVTVKPDTIALETTQYRGYAATRRLLECALHAVAGAVAIDGITRIGLRYIDEIRVPSDDVLELPRWEEWVDASLIGPLGITIDHGLTPVANAGTAVFSSGETAHVVLRYGAQDTYVIGSSPQLRRPLPSPGPLFKLDIDSYWEPRDIPEFDSDTALATADKLHTPVRSLFEGLITDKLRNEVLRHV